MAKLRRLLTADYSIFRVGSMTGDDVLDQVAKAISSGRLLVCPEMKSGGVVQAASGAAPDPPPFPLSERRPRVPAPSFSPPVSDLPSFSPDINVAAQAATLVAAAVDGKPFCAECAAKKAALEAAKLL